MKIFHWAINMVASLCCFGEVLFGHLSGSDSLILSCVGICLVSLARLEAEIK